MASKSTNKTKNRKQGLDKAGHFTISALGQISNAVKPTNKKKLSYEERMQRAKVKKQLAQKFGVHISSIYHALRDGDKMAKRRKELKLV